MVQPSLIFNRGDKALKKIIIDCNNKDIVDGFKRNDIACIPVTPSDELFSQMSCHTDCLIYVHSNNIFVDLSNYKNIVNILTSEDKYNIVLLDNRVTAPYPEDIKLNIKVFGKYVLCNSRFISENLKRYFIDIGFNLLNCNQGYAACSTLKINDCSAITDDESIYRTLISAGIDCLHIRKGSILLKGYDYGFIGGASGVIDNTVYFFGDIKYHPDCNRIINFIKMHGADYINLFDGPLVDIGSFVVI